MNKQLRKGLPALLCLLLCVLTAAARAESLYVVDQARNAVHLYNEQNGGYVDAGDFATSGLDSPTGIAIGPDGSVYVANSGSNTVHKFNVYGNDLGAVLFANISAPTAIAINRSGQIAVANSATNTVLFDGVTGSATPSSTWLFAEGSTVNNFETYFTVLNPDPQRPAVVTGTFFDQAGNVLGNSTIVVNPLRRGNIKLNALVRSSGIATILTSSVPVLVERPLYFGSPNGGAGAGGSDVFGRNGGGTSWLFPEGNTAGSFREFLLLQNPGGLAAEVRVRFYGTAGQVVDRTLTLVPRSRFTLDVLRDVGALGAGQHSSLVTSTNGVPIIVEQSIYSDNFTRGDGVAGIAQ